MSARLLAVPALLAVTPVAPAHLHTPAEQAGPAGGVGVRENAQGFDLNRDFVKLESPEVRGLVRLIDLWKPLLVVDCHTTNGSYHRFTLTYDGPRHPAADPRLIDAARG